MGGAAFPPPSAGLWIAAGALLGLLVGSFLNVVAYRWPRGESVVWPASHCPGCQRALPPWENVPLLSWLALGGRCSGCHMRIALRYPLVELATGLLFAGLVARFGLGLDTLLWLTWSAALLAAALIDFEHHVIPDGISLGGLAAALVAMPLLAWIEGAELPAALQRSLAGALLGGGLLWSVGFVHARVCAAFGRRFDHWPGEGEDFPAPASADFWLWFPGLGFGDVKLLAMIGAVLGPWGVLQALVLATLAGLAGGIAGLLSTRRFDQPFGFGPALVAGALAVALGLEIRP